MDRPSEETVARQVDPPDFRSLSVMLLPARLPLQRRRSPLEYVHDPLRAFPLWTSRSVTCPWAVPARPLHVPVRSLEETREEDEEEEEEWEEEDSEESSS